MLRIDYHFHPNLPESDSLALQKCKKWWNEFKKNDIKCVVVTEHIYKNPRRAFEFMDRTKPSGFYCFPGVEYLSKEGIDLVMFSDNVSIYTRLHSFDMVYEDAISFIASKKNIYGYVTHPYTLGLTSVMRLGNRVYRKSVDKLGAVEVSNGSFDNLLILMKTFPFNLFMKKRISRIYKHQMLPKRDYPKKVKFLAVGSDAHDFYDIGNCLQIDSIKGKIFNSVISNKGKIMIKKKKFNLSSLLRNAQIVRSEYNMKKRIKYGFK